MVRKGCVGGTRVHFLHSGRVLQVGEGPAVRNEGVGIALDERAAAAWKDAGKVWKAISSHIIMARLPNYKSHPYFRPVIYGFVWLLYLTRTFATLRQAALGRSRTPCLSAYSTSLSLKAAV